MSLSQHAENFRNNRQALSPIFKPETNIPAKILSVKHIGSSIETSTQDGKEYAQLKLQVEVETTEGIKIKDWNIASENLVTALEDKGVDVGSSFTITKKGEGFKTKYEITNVVNKPVATGTQSTVETQPEQKSFEAQAEDISKTQE